MCLPIFFYFSYFSFTFCDIIICLLDNFYILKCWSVRKLYEPHHEKKALRSKPFSTYAQLLSGATCLAHWLKFPLALLRMIANSIGSNETVWMPRLVCTFNVYLCYNGSFPRTRLIWISHFFRTENCILYVLTGMHRPCFKFPLPQFHSFKQWLSSLYCVAIFVKSVFLS